MSEGDTGRDRDEPQGGPEMDVPPVAFSEAKVPEVPASRVPMAAPEPSPPAPPVPHDVWGKVENPAPRPVAETPPAPPAPEAPAFEAPASGSPLFEPQGFDAQGFGPSYGEPSYGEQAYREPPYGEPLSGGPLSEPVAPAGPAVPPPAPPAGADAEDVKVAPVEESPHWEGSLFDEGDGDARYEPAVPTGSDLPARPGKPSSGNWQMPDWMADEAAADAKLGGSPAPPRTGGDEYDEDFGGGRGRLVLIGGVGLLVAALVAAGGVYLMKGRGEDKGAKNGKTPASSGGKGGRAAPPAKPRKPKITMPPDKLLRKFPGTPSKTVGRVADARSGLVWPRLAAPWQVPGKKSGPGTAGWSGRQITVTERHGGRLWYGQLLTGALAPNLRGAYQGPENVKAVSGLAAKGFETQYYTFPHRTAPLASQALTVDGHRGWLVASYLTYDRDGVKATGEIVATAVIDTGRPVPAVVFASLPNSNKKLWPDLGQFLSGLKVVE